MLRNKFIYLCLLAYMVSVAILYNEYSTMLALLVLVSIPVILLAVLLLTAPFITVTLPEQEINVNKKEDFTIPIRLENRSCFPLACGKIRLSYSNHAGIKKIRKEIEVFTETRGEQEIHCNMEAEYCGNIVMTCESIRIYDYFRLFSIKRKIRQSMMVSVLPDLKELSVPLPPQAGGELWDGDTFSKSKSGDDPSEVFDIREYRLGDKLHRIHWKLSAKKDEYMVKEFSQPITPGAVILLDLFFDGPKRVLTSYLDSILEKAVSISFTLMLHECAHYFAWYHEAAGGVRRILIQEAEELYLVIGELLEATVYKDRTILVKEYKALYEQEGIPCYYYVGNGDMGQLEGMGRILNVPDDSYPDAGLAE